MRTLKKNIAVIILLTHFFFIIPSNSYSQTITGAAALVAIDEIEDKLNAVVSNAENAGNSIINNGAFQATTLIYNFKSTYKDILNSSTAFLDQNTYNIFLNIKSASSKILNGATDFVAELDNTILTLHSVMSRIPLFSKKPIITKPVIPVFIRNSSIDEYEIQLNGSLLNLKSKMKINGKHIKPSEMTDKRLVYHVEGKILQEALSKRRVNFKLRIKYGWLSLKGAKFSYFAKTIPQDYALVEVTANTITNDTIKIFRVETMPATRTDASNWRGKRKSSKDVFTVYPSQTNNPIDINSVQLEILENRYGYGAEIISKTPAAILIQQHARSKDKPYGGGGKVQSKLSFTEFGITSSSGSQTLKDIPLIFNDPLVIKLPNNAVAVQSIKVKLFDGKTITLTTENNNKNFEVEFRPIDKTLFIKNVKL